MTREYTFPFTAVVGQEKIKRALLLNAVNPRIGGVLISGQKGTAKSTLVRGLAKLLPDMEVVELPLNVTEDRLLGTIDVEKAIASGIKSFEPGLLAEADGNILYVDEVNLLSEHIVNSLLDVAQSGVNIVEREGISHEHRSSFVLVGSMNPEEGMLSPQFLDRFGLFVEVTGEADLDDRKEIIARRLAYERSPDEFIKTYKEQGAEIAAKILGARKFFSQVEITDNIMKMAADLARQAFCQGHRADIVLVETARTMAAFAERTYISLDDLKEAAELALPHRIRQVPPYEIQEQETQETEEKTPPQQMQQPPENEESRERPDLEQTPQDSEQDLPAQQHEGRDHRGQDETAANESLQQPESSEELVEDPGKIFRVITIQTKPFERKMRKGSGKRSRTKTSSRQGRYIRYRLPQGKLKDLAFDATLRAAAMAGRGRNKDGFVRIEKSDYREKVREKRIGNTLLFVVDASGSMGANRRMKATKTAILSLLNDAYQKRDIAGLVVFRKTGAESLLGITRSVELANKKLRELPTGGKTPLPAGLALGYEILKARKVKDPDTVPVLVLVTDGRANVSLNGGDPVEEAKEIGRKIRAEGINTLVIDSEQDFITLGLAKELAEIMEAQYYKLEALQVQEIETAVRSFLQ